MTSFIVPLLKVHELSLVIIIQTTAPSPPSSWSSVQSSFKSNRKNIYTFIRVSSPGMVSPRAPPSDATARRYWISRDATASVYQMQKYLQFY